MRQIRFVSFMKWGEVVNPITKETRRESFIARPAGERQRAILDVLSVPMTARQIAKELGFSDLNAVRPRLTEMTGNQIEVCGKAYDELTMRKVAVYRRKDDVEM